MTNEVLEKDSIPLRNKEQIMCRRCRELKISSITGYPKEVVHEILQVYLDSCLEELFLKTEELAPSELKTVRMGIPGIGDVFLQKGKDIKKGYPRFSFSFKPYFDFRTKVLKVVREKEHPNFDYGLKSEDLSFLEDNKKEVVEEDTKNSFEKEDVWNW